MIDEEEILEIENDDGSVIQLQVVEYFEHKNDEFVILADLAQLTDVYESEDEDAAEDVGFYVLKVLTAEDGTKEYVDPDDSMLEELFGVAEGILDELYACCDDDCDDEDCSCGCHHHEE